MIELEPPLPEAFKALFKPLENNLSSVSILRGLTKSKIYADSLDPSWAVTYSNSRILVAGDIETPELLVAVQRVVDRGIASGKRGFVIYYSRETKKQVIGKHISDVKSYPNLRNYYVFEPEGKKQIDLPYGFVIEQISEDLLSERYHNTELVENEIISERASVKDFLDSNFGFCAIQGDSITAWCTSEYNTGNRFEIGIETHPDYRRRGLAYHTAIACINHGLKNGYGHIGWHCWKKNEPSNQLALKLDFSYIMEYPVEYLKVK